MKITLFTLLLAFALMAPLRAQHLGSTKNQVGIGLGAGLPYGGLGAKVSYNPADQFTLFAGLGYNFVGAGYNGGFLYSFPTEKQTEVYLTGMYGYNAVINVEGSPSQQKTYMGPSFGVGVKINSLRKQGAYWDLSLLVPARSQDFKDTWDGIKADPNIQIETDPWPVLFSFGYNFPISSD